MKLPPSSTKQISTHNKQTQTHKPTPAPLTEPSPSQSISTKPTKTDTGTTSKAIIQALNIATQTLTTSPENTSTQTQRVETSITTITKLSARDINRLTTLLPKEHLTNLTKTNSANNTANLEMSLLTLKISNSQKTLNAIAKSGWQVGTKIHIEHPVVSAPKLFILEEKPLPNSSELFTPTKAYKSTANPPISQLQHKSDAEFTHITRKALVDIGLRKYLPQQIDKSLAGEIINQLILSKRTLTQANQNVHSTQLKQATTDVIKALSQLEKAHVNTVQIMTPTELKSAIKNSGTFLESHIKNNIKHTVETPPLKTDLTINPKELSTNEAILLKNNDGKLALNQLGNKQTHEITSLNKNLKQHDLKAILLNLIATITTLQNTPNTQITQPTLNLTGFDKLLKTLITTGGSTKEAKTNQQQVLDNIKTLANNLLNRISTNQLLSLSKSQNDQTIQTFTSLDIPLKIGDQCLPLHMQIEERFSERENNDDNKNGSNKEKGEKSPLTSSWHVILEFSFLEKGDFYSAVDIYGDVLKSTLWAENPDIRKALDIHLPKLEAQLIAQGIVVEELRTVKNKPVGNTNQIKHHLVDIKT